MKINSIYSVSNYSQNTSKVKFNGAERTTNSAKYDIVQQIIVRLNTIKSDAYDLSRDDFVYRDALYERIVNQTNFIKDSLRKLSILNKQ